ncbi:MAG: ADP-glyceromanno-heptose 6-epimerase [Bdellovibrionaceae bacterium]|nr:ADP-glyceromanno-heptose 6-epimerase [Pseudobdellovibrionaceae bacterium]MBX3032641.1 ADP-glyceromanno-heptose 6-epimerase [Pseudobdellovibrionaceae bacterium]
MIIVTGANGFIGSALVWELNQRGIANILAVDPVGRDVHDLLGRRTIADFIHRDRLWDFLQSPAADSVSWVFHLGACSSTTETDWDFLRRNNLEYSQKLFTWCAEKGKNLVYASSAATYGAGEHGFSDRTDAEILKPLNLYGESKVQMDRWAAKQKKTPPRWYGLKFFNVFGPNEYFKGPMASLVFKAYHQIRKTGELGLFKSYNPRFRDGEQVRDFIYVKDVTRWMVELMDRQPANGVYNMGFGQARSWLDLAQAVFKASGKTPKIKWLEIPDNIRNQYQYFTEASMDKWRGQGMSPPQWPLEKAIEDDVKNHLAAKDAVL